MERDDDWALNYYIIMMKAILRAVVLILLVTIGSCTKDVIDTTGDLVGIVSDSQTGEPLSGVSYSFGENLFYR